MCVIVCLTYINLFCVFMLHFCFVHWFSELLLCVCCVACWCLCRAFVLRVLQIDGEAKFTISKSDISRVASVYSGSEIKVGAAAKATMQV